MKRIFNALLELYIFNILKSDYQLPKKNVLNALMKALVLKIFKFLFWLFGHVEKTGLIREIRFISTFMMSQPG